MGVVGRTETGTKGMAEIDVVNTAVTGAEDMTRIGAVGATEVVATDTPMSAASSNPSKGSANERNGHTNKKG